MEDSKGNQISIGDRVKVLWGFDNKIYRGEIIKIRKDVVTIKSIGKKVTISDRNKITKIPEEDEMILLGL